ncbi:MAG: phasin family protein [Caulobacterales bacterium]|jgi:phasin family protein
MATASKTLKSPKTAEAAHAAFEHVTAASSEAMRTNMDRSMAAMSEASAFGKENMEAFVASAAVAQKGMEAVSARYMAFTKSAMENHMAVARSLMTSKSVQELVERQTEYARSSFDSYVAELTVMSDLMAGVTKDAIKPLNERMTAMSSLMQTAAGR